MMPRAVCDIGLKVCLKGLLQLNRGVVVFPGRKVMEVAERCKRKGWNCPHLENKNSCYHVMEEMDHEHGDL